MKKEDQHDHGSSFRANLEAERNNFMLYLRGEVFIRAALVKVKSAKKARPHPILTHLSPFLNSIYLDSFNLVIS